MNRKALAIALISLLGLAGVASPTMSEEEVKLGGRRIVGGEQTDIKNHPWQVAVNVHKDGQTYLCGGSIIARQWVLSAAHCFAQNLPPAEVKAKSGVTDYVAGGSWGDVDRLLVHENFDPSTYVNDIAVMRLKSPPQGRVIPLMAASDSLRVGQYLEVTGWGASSENSGASRDLLKGSVPYVENATCNEPSSYNGAIKPGMMCAGYREGGIDSCQGDSGGPLVWRSPDGPVLVGVVSFGEGCARKLKYGVYTRVSEYRPWINRVMAANRN
jgi:trypsin